MSLKVSIDTKLDFNNVLIIPKKSDLKSRSEVNLNIEHTFKHSPLKWSGIPIMVANMDTTGTFEMAEELSKHKIITCLHKHYTLDDWTNFLKDKNDFIYDYITLSIGTNTNDYNNMKSILNKFDKIKFIMIDVANGYSSYFVNFIKKIRNEYKDKIIIAGNVVTPEMVEELIVNGADIVKIGIGPGSVCTTRKKTGIGFPQLSCILECKEISEKLGGKIISDGGCTCPGDFGKGFGAGADFIMSGGMFSGHKESGGEIIEKNGVLYKSFYGMSSKKAMNTYSGGVANYRTSEGKEVLIKYKGEVNDTINDILGGIRSTCTYVGAKNLKNLYENTNFIKVTQQLNNVYN
jgi:GMP reductase